jgi:hypothetical protein
MVKELAMILWPVVHEFVMQVSATSGPKWRSWLDMSLKHEEIRDPFRVFALRQILLPPQLQNPVHL